MSLSEFYDNQRAYQSSVSQVRDRAKWREPVAAFKAPQKKQPKGSMVKVDPGLSQDVAKAVAAACPVIAEPFNKNLGALALEAFKEWPVKSGLSRSQVDLVYKTTETRLEGVVVCRTPYAYMIREKTKRAPSAGGRANKTRRSATKSSRPTDEKTSRWLKIASNPARKKDPKIWKAATMVASRSMRIVTYAGVMTVYRRIQGKGSIYIKAFAAGVDLVSRGASPSTVERQIQKQLNKIEKKNKKAGRGKRVADVLIFKPSARVADKIAQEIATNIAKEFGL